MRRPIPGQKHHWFPKALAKAWADSDGLVWRTNSKGHSKRWHPSAIGYAPNSHNILSEGGSPWDSTFEPDFDVADNAFPKIIRWLDAIRDEHPAEVRVKGLAISNEHRASLAECLASLIVRSPRLRYLSEKWTAQIQVRDFGFSEPRNLHETAGANLRRCQEPFSREVRTGGKPAFLIAGEGSFLFGDGFMTTFHPTPDRVLRPMAMVAFTPKVAVLWFSPGSYPLYPKGVSLRLNGDEVSSFNEIVQIYSKDHLFHIGPPPNLHSSFPESQHYIVHSNGADHRTPVVDGWMAEVLAVSEPG